MGRALNDSVRVPTASGTVDATLVGTGDADIETGSSAIRVRGINGGVKAMTRSGRVSLQGRPASAWNVSPGSGAVDIALDPATPSRRRPLWRRSCIGLPRYCSRADSPRTSGDLRSPGSSREGASRFRENPRGLSRPDSEDLDAGSESETVQPVPAENPRGQLNY